MGNMVEDKIFSVPGRFFGRKHEEPLHRYRSQFQRDRDRVLYSKPFRRLNGKTQVFMPTAHDHVRNRLTHTLEVAQIARVTAKNLGLDRELTEAIALAHDLGHTPFGHVGERALNLIMNGCETVCDRNTEFGISDVGFKHNWQSVRICSEINRLYPEFSGMNLTNYTLWGVLNHSSKEWKGCGNFLEDRCYLGLHSSRCRKKGALPLGFYEPYQELVKAKDATCEAWSFEARVVNLADEIAQRHHDIEDALYLDILSVKDILEVVFEYFGELFQPEDFVNYDQARANPQYFKQYMAKFIVNMYNRDLIENTMRNFKEVAVKYSIKDRGDFACLYVDTGEELQKAVGYSEGLEKADEDFQLFLRNSILNSFWAQRMDGKGQYVIKRLFKAYMTNPKQLHDSTIIAVFNLYEDRDYDVNVLSKMELGKKRNAIGSPEQQMDNHFQIALLRAICDHIAGMTDNFVLSEYSRLYGEAPLA